MSGNADITKLIRGHIEDPDDPDPRYDDAFIACQMNQSAKVLARNTRFLSKTERVDLVQGDQDYALPTRWMRFPKEGVEIELNTNTPPETIVVTHDRKSEVSVGDRDEEQPRVFTIWEKQFRLQSPSSLSVPNGIKYFYYAFPAPFIDLQLPVRDTVSDFPEQYEEALILHTSAMIKHMDNEEEAALQLMAMARQEIDEIRDEELDDSGDPGQVQDTYDETLGDVDSLSEQLHTF